VRATKVGLVVLETQIIWQREGWRSRHPIQPAVATQLPVSFFNSFFSGPASVGHPMSSGSQGGTEGSREQGDAATPSQTFPQKTWSVVMFLG